MFGQPDPDFVDSGDTSFHYDHPLNWQLSPSFQSQTGAFRGRPPMSTRQNNKKQRKGRNNANNRERTVTTLTEDPNTPYLIPTPSEEPAGSLMSAFSGPPTAAKIHNMSMGPPGYQISGNFGGFGYNSSFPPMHHQAQQQPYFSPSVNQPHVQPQQQQLPQKHQPAANNFKLPPGKNDLEILQKLKKMILENQHPHYRAEPSPSYLASLYKGPPAQDVQPFSPPGFALFGGHSGKMPTRKEKRNTSGGIQQNNGNQNNRHGASSNNNVVSDLDVQSLKISKNLSAPPSSSRPDPRSSDPSAPSTDHSAGSNANQDVPDAQRQARYDYPSRRIQKSDSAPAAVDRTAYEMNIDVPAYGGKDDLSHPGSWAPRDSAPSDVRSFERERATTPRPLNPGGPTSVDTHPPGGANRGAGPPGDGSDREILRRGEWQPDRDRHVSHDQNTTDARQSSAASEQRPTEAGYDQHPAHRGGTNDPSIPGLSDSRPPASTDVRDSNVVSDTPPSARDLADTRPPGDSQQPDTRTDSHAVPPRSAERVGHDINGEDIQSSRSSSVRPADPIPVPLGPSSFPPATPASGDVESSDDPSQRPSLKDRMSQQPPSRQASGDGGHHYPPNPPHKKKFQKGHYGGPPKGGFARSAPHDGPPPQSGGQRTFRPRSPPPSKLPPSPSRGPPRDFRPRDLSRDRAGGYRPDAYDPRRPEIVDPDAPMTGRYDGRPGYDDFSAPPPMSGGRGPPPGPDVPGRGDYYRQYPPGRRGEWEDDEYYKSRGWAPADRERYERDYPPRSAGWDTMSEREYHPRDYPPVEGRYVPGPPVDRSRPPPPAGYPPYGRVRPRSPSPLRRSGSGAIDDSRPPMKRAREDFPPGDYYPGGGGGRRPSEYPPPPPRAGSPGAPPTSGWAPPPPGSGASSGPPGDRDYRMEYPPPGGYDRPRTPPSGPPGGRMPYNRGPGGYGRGGGGEPRDRSGYGMPAPRG